MQILSTIKSYINSSYDSNKYFPIIVENIYLTTNQMKAINNVKCIKFLETHSLNFLTELKSWKWGNKIERRNRIV